METASSGSDQTKAERRKKKEENQTKIDDDKQKVMEKKENINELGRRPLVDAIQGKSIESEAEDDGSEYKSELESESKTKKNGTLILDVEIY